MLRVIQCWNVDVSSLPSQKQTEEQQDALVRVQQAQPDCNVVYLTGVHVRLMKNIVIFRVVLETSFHDNKNVNVYSFIRSNNIKAL